MTKNYIPDPIHGSIEIPTWLAQIKEEDSIRRMMLIRQLGLKAYIDYPGAIHTRYSHVQGVMHLAGRVVDLLEGHERKSRKTEIADNLHRNKSNIMAAGFLHDIGHGPFSHVCDHVLKKYSRKTHEEIGIEILEGFDLEKEGISIQSVKKIITGEHEYPFISDIINGPLDVDKLDYLLRDAHHVGFRYSIDLNHFIKNFRILGSDRSDLHHCELGLENSQQAVVTSEIFIIIWKSMYDLVYHVEDSRIAEKMLEKALLLRSQDDSDFKSNFASVEKFVKMQDEKLLEELRSKNDFAGKLAESITGGKTYKVFSKTLNKEKSSGWKLSEDFECKANEDPDRLSDWVSLEMAKKLECTEYKVICDIIKSKAPKQINIDEFESSAPIELNTKSQIINSIKPELEIRTYIDKSFQENTEKHLISKSLKEIIEYDTISW